MGKIISQAYTDCIMRPFPSLQNCVAIILIGKPIVYNDKPLGEIVLKQVWSRS